MSPRQVPENELRAVLKAFKASGGNKSRAAKLLGMPKTTFLYQLREAQIKNTKDETEELILPDLPSSELDAEELIEQACARFSQHKTAKDARKWMPIKITANKPIGVCFMGDPHIDNIGCNWPLLKRDIDILENTEGMYAVNMGDMTDNWIGRLMRLYADSQMSKKQAWKLAKYILKDAKIKWLCHILGNHDLWGDGPYLIKANAHPMVPVEDWQSRFQIVFPNNAAVRVYAAHDFPGTSIWNKLHGAQRAALMNDEAEIYACGHKHEWAINTSEHPQRGFVYHLIRARGYKFIDQFAEVKGYGSQDYGASIVAIIDPRVEGPSRTVCFADLADAASYLTYRRGRK